MKIKDMIVSSLFAGITAVLAPWSIPLGGQIPFTLGLIAVFITSMVLGGRRSFWAMLIYIALGAAGLPVFSGFRGGFSVIAGPTGGYIASYIIIAPVMGYLAHRKKECGRIEMILVMLLGLFICYALGTAWFMYLRKMSLYNTLALTVIPFVAFDVLKILIASILSYDLRKILQKSNLI